MIPNRWYPILESAALRDQPIALERLGQRLVLWRPAPGRIACAPALCPHRGADLSQGAVVDGALACPWHGFRYAEDGRCTLMPCEGVEARAPRAIQLGVRPVREENGLAWLWSGDADAARDSKIPFFTDELAGLQASSSETSYLLPYHYTRMVESNLDLHHVPFAHGRVFPTGSKLDDFEARLAGDRISTAGRLVDEVGKRKPFAFRADLLLPNLVYIELGDKLSLVVAATPVNDTSSWLWFRYHQRYVGPSLRWIGKLVTWVAVRFELAVVQPQDWRIFAGMSPGSVDELDDHLVGADRGIALYRRWRSESLRGARDAAAREIRPVTPLTRDRPA